MSCLLFCVVFFFKQKTAYEMRISDWSSDVCSSDLAQIFVLASGGTYLTLENGKPTGFAPLKALENKPEDRAWLSLWVRQLVRAESRPITVQEERMIDEGIAAVMRLPRE